MGAGRPPTRHQVVIGVESHPQKVADLGSDFGLVGLKKNPGLTAILVPGSNNMEDRTQVVQVQESITIFVNIHIVCR